MTIEDWRVEIDKIDGELLRLLNARAELAVRVGESKRVRGSRSATARASATS